MNAEFNWWLLIVGLVVGAGLVWLVIADWSRREEDLAEEEISAESAWIAQTLRDRGEAIDPAAAEEVLALHRAYLRQTIGPDAEPTDEDEIAAPDWTDEPIPTATVNVGTDVAAAPTTTDNIRVTDRPTDRPSEPAAAEPTDRTTDRPDNSAASEGATGRLADWPAQQGTDRATDWPSDVPAPERPSVRATRLSPRAGPGSLESEPPS